MGIQSLTRKIGEQIHTHPMKLLQDISRALRYLECAVCIHRRLMASGWGFTIRTRTVCKKTSDGTRTYRGYVISQQVRVVRTRARRRGDKTARQGDHVLCLTCLHVEM